MDREDEARKVNALQDKVADKHVGRVAKAIEEAMREVAKGLPTGGRLDPAPEHFRSIDDAMRAMYRHITRETAAYMVGRFKSGFEWIETKNTESGFYDRLYEEFMSIYGGLKISQINATTRRQIVRIVERGLKEGLSVDEIAAELLAAAPVVGETRAAIIARTETHSASMWASLQSARRSTVPLLKEWVSVEDARTRDFGEGDGIVDEFSHRIMNEVKVPIDDPFEVPTSFGITEKLMFPGDPAGSPANIINCRCSQVYVEADEVDDDTEETGGRVNTAPPSGDARARLLDKIKGEQPVFWPNQDGAFDAAPLLFWQAIAKAGDLKQVYADPKGAYADWNGGISMGMLTPGGLDYKHVFRHEYGHFVDLQIAKKMRADTGRGPGRFASFRAIDALVEDGSELMARKSKIGYGEASTGVAPAARNAEAFLDRVDELVEKYDDSDDLLRDLIPEVEPKDIWKLYNSTNREVEAAARIAASWERRDVMQAIGELPPRLSGQRVSHSTAFAGMQDTFEASNGVASSMQFGHGKHYYQSNNEWTQEAGLAKTFGRRKFNGYATGQAFANWFDAYGDPNPAAYALYKRLYPRTSAVFEEMLEEFVNG